MAEPLVELKPNIDERGIVQPNVVEPDFAQPNVVEPDIDEPNVVVNIANYFFTSEKYK
ncbi:hypothetical protein A2U01_0067977, partial [Trifolium medium]|nr:hypothetical protein [Trifolium medium]